MNSRSFLFTAFLFTTLVDAQTQVRFDSIADQTIVINPEDPNNYKTLQKNFYSFVGNGIDSIDVEAYLKGIPLATLIFKITKVNEPDPTYRQLLAETIKLKEIPKYKILRDRLIIEKKLAKCPAEYKYWEQNKVLLQQGGITGEVLNNIEKYIRENENKAISYQDILQQFQERNDIDKKL